MTGHPSLAERDKSEENVVSGVSAGPERVARDGLGERAIPTIVM